jgi:hypothetical protein
MAPGRERLALPRHPDRLGCRRTLSAPDIRIVERPPCAAQGMRFRKMPTASARSAAIRSAVCSVNCPANNRTPLKRPRTGCVRFEPRTPAKRGSIELQAHRPTSISRYWRTGCHSHRCIRGTGRGRRPPSPGGQGRPHPASDTGCRRRARA